MKTIIYTYENFKPVFFERPRFYVIKNARQMENLIEELLDIDAVASPADLTFPAILELKAGFAPTLTEVSLEYVKEEQKKMLEFTKIARKASNSKKLRNKRKK